VAPEDSRLRQHHSRRAKALSPPTARTALTCEEGSATCATSTPVVAGVRLDGPGSRRVGIVRRVAVVGHQLPTVPTRALFAATSSATVSIDWQTRGQRASWSDWISISGLSGLGGLGRLVDTADGRLGRVRHHARSRSCDHAWVGLGGLWWIGVPLDGSINASLHRLRPNSGRPARALRRRSVGHRLQHRWQAAPKAGWAPLGIRCPAPTGTRRSTSAANADRRLEIVGRTAHGSSSTTGRSRPRLLDELDSAWRLRRSVRSMIADTNADGRLEVFARGYLGDLIHGYQLGASAAPVGRPWGASGRQAPDRSTRARKPMKSRLEALRPGRRSGTVMHSWQVRAQRRMVRAGCRVLPATVGRAARPGREQQRQTAASTSFGHAPRRLTLYASKLQL